MGQVDQLGSLVGSYCSCFTKFFSEFLHSESFSEPLKETVGIQFIQTVALLFTLKVQLSKGMNVLPTVFSMLTGSILPIATVSRGTNVSHHYQNAFKYQIACSL